ncbi:MAG: hypothetical protein ACK5YT_01050 [Bacteroidota bacterium]
MRERTFQYQVNNGITKGFTKTKDLALLWSWGFLVNGTYQKNLF